MPGARTKYGVKALSDTGRRLFSPVALGGSRQARFWRHQHRRARRILRQGRRRCRRLFRIELLNPTKESFDDWNDPDLQATVGGGRRVIPNGGLAFKDPDDIGGNSGQNIQDANLIKVRITHGYRSLTSLRFIGNIYTRYLQWLDPGGDAFYTALVDAGRIPVVSHATVLMQSDAIEPGAPVSSPGPGNNGTPSDPGDPPVTTTPPPDCGTAGCTTPSGPARSGEGDCVGNNCPPCTPVGGG